MNAHELEAMRESVLVASIFAEKGTTRHEKLNRIASKLDAAAAWRILAESASGHGMASGFFIGEAERLESEARQIENTLGRDD